LETAAVIRAATEAGMKKEPEVSGSAGKCTRAGLQPRQLPPQFLFARGLF